MSRRRGTVVTASTPTVSEVSMPQAYPLDAELSARLAGLDSSDREVAEGYLTVVAQSPAPACLVWQERAGILCIAHNDSFGASFGRHLVGEVLLDALPE